MRSARRAALIGLALAALPGPSASAAPERSKAHVLPPRAGISVSVEVVYDGHTGGVATGSAPTVVIAALPGDSGASDAVFASTTSASFSTGVSFDRAACLRRRVGGGWGDTLSFCVAEAEDTTRVAPGPAQERRRVSPEAVARVLADRAMALAPDPRIEVAPAGVGLTGLDSYFWLDQAAPITASAGVGGVIVTAQARPVQYVWDFGDGHDRVTSHPGRPWTRNRPGDIAHMYEGRARYELGVEQIWEARWRIAGGTWRRLGFFSNSDARAYRVRQVVPVLVPDR
ncbi:hypothetical protein BH24ACT26_BH24ACT26_18980 [soil metagenome]